MKTGPESGPEMRYRIRRNPHTSPGTVLPTVDPLDYRLDGLLVLWIIG